MDCLALKGRIELVSADASPSCHEPEDSLAPLALLGRPLGGCSLGSTGGSSPPDVLLAGRAPSLVRIGADGRAAPAGFSTALIYAIRSLVEILVTLRLVSLGGFWPGFLRLGGSFVGFGLKSPLLGVASVVLSSQHWPRTPSSGAFFWPPWFSPCGPFFLGPPLFLSAFPASFL